MTGLLWFAVGAVIGAQVTVSVLCVSFLYATACEEL